LTVVLRFPDDAQPPVPTTSTASTCCRIVYDVVGRPDVTARGVVILLAGSATRPAPRHRARFSAGRLVYLRARPARARPLGGNRVLLRTSPKTHVTSNTLVGLPLKTSGATRSSSATAWRRHRVRHGVEHPTTTTCGAVADRRWRPRLPSLRCWPGSPKPSERSRRFSDAALASSACPRPGRGERLRPTRCCITAGSRGLVSIAAAGRRYYAASGAVADRASTCRARIRLPPDPGRGSPPVGPAGYSDVERNRYPGSITSCFTTLDQTCLDTLCRGSTPGCEWAAPKFLPVRLFCGWLTPRCGAYRSPVASSRAPTTPTRPGVPVRSPRLATRRHRHGTTPHHEEPKTLRGGAGSHADSDPRRQSVNAHHIAPPAQGMGTMCAVRADRIRTTSGVATSLNSTLSVYAYGFAEDSDATCAVRQPGRPMVLASDSTSPHAQHRRPRRSPTRLIFSVCRRAVGQRVFLRPAHTR